ncbi:apolipoprotein N-acyltransferase [Leucobacter sp. OH2974_COT-288]|nr:apolipoprotein N-acyltransferase [Leucobacter sp. OH2974_COT-288]
MFAVLWRGLLAVTGGVLLDLSRPGSGIWPLAFVAVGCYFAAIYGSGKRVAALVGALGGAAFWLPHLHWLTLYLGAVPWLALAGFMTLWFTVFNVLVTVLLTSLARLLCLPQLPVVVRSLVQSVALAAVYAGLWLLRELGESSWPYGGFAWGRFAASFADSPFAGAVSFWGVAATGAVLVFAGVLPVATFAVLRHASRELPPSQPRTVSPTGMRFAAVAWLDSVPAARLRPILGATLLTVTVLAAQLLLPQPVLTQRDNIRIAAVQGNAKAGIFDDRENGDVFRAHFDATTAFLEGLDPAAPRPELIVWPENGAEFNVTGSPRRMRELQQLAAFSGADIMVGTILPGHNPGDGTAFNAAVTVTAAGEVTARYDKYNPVPFGEFMPNREFFRMFAPELVDLVQLEYLPGERPSVRTLRQAAIGHAICFDITFDRQTTAMLDGGAELFVALTNNADFGRTDESLQQLALTKLQALSAGRALVNISTVGQSQILAPDGSSLASIAAFTPGVITADVPVLTGETIATKYGAWFALLWGLLPAATAAVIFSVRIARIWRTRGTK